MCYCRCVFRLQRSAKATAEAEYPAYGVTGPGGGGGEKVGSPGDRKLAHSAQMYHYQHQKQQMLAMEKYVLMLYSYAHHRESTHCAISSMCL